MDVREKLVELLKEAPYNIFGNKLGNCYFDSCLEMIADHLIAHGVTVQECKLGVKKTNADRIRSMSDEELAIHLNIGWECSTCKEQIWIDNKFSLGDCDMNCVGHCLEWLKKPAEVSE